MLVIEIGGESGDKSPHSKMGTRMRYCIYEIEYYVTVERNRYSGLDGLANRVRGWPLEGGKDGANSFGG